MLYGPKKKVDIVIPILCIACLTMLNNVGSIVIADVLKAFPDTGEVLSQFTYTITTLFAVIANFVIGFASRYISRKKLIVFSLCVMFAGGMIAGFFPINIWVVLIAGGIIGFGKGGIATLSMSLVASYCQGEKKSSMIGVRTSASYFGGMILTLVAGELAVIKWNYAYLVFLVIFPVIFIAAKWLPSNDMAVITGQQPEQRASRDFKFNPAILFFCFVSFAFSVLHSIWGSNYSLFISRTGLGDAALAGTVSSVTSLAGFIMGVIFGFIYSRTKKYVFVLGCTCTLLSFTLMVTTVSVPTLFLASFLSSAGSGIVFSSNMLAVANLLGPKNSTIGVAMINVTGDLGYFFSPAIIDAIYQVAKPTVAEGKFFIGVIGLAIMWVILLAGTFVKQLNFVQADKEKACAAA